MVKGIRRGGVIETPPEPAFVEISGVQIDYSTKGEASYWKPIKLPEAVEMELAEFVLTECY